MRCATPKCPYVHQDAQNIEDHNTRQRMRADGWDIQRRTNQWKPYCANCTQERWNQ